MVGVADLNAPAAQVLARDLSCTVASTAELLDKVDLLLITTPPASHYLLARQALEAGVEVVMEKPFVVTLAQAEDLVSIARRQGRRLSVAHFRRCYPKLQLAREIVRSGLIGPIVGLGAFEGGKFGWGTSSGYVGRDPAGGVLLDTGSHTLDMALFAAGLDESEFAVRARAVARDKPEPAHEVDARFELALSDRVVSGRIFVSRTQALANLVRLQGKKGWLEFGVGPAGPVRVEGPDGGFLANPTALPGTEVDAFAAQYADILSGVDNSTFAAHRFVGQIKILDRLLHHE